ncbi:MAG: hypothetical protein ETSY2_51335 [Candidatus Entotheonella gemina]|uniref:EamA domain-containing protein n=1 Tax=Candidatus Entotheonella gemina TaxID=1429439 RepID=W4L5W3_9BACT|nr:MAG: hypothetical protein ETSY2_51335 [Candidatus Entotheonella gemina]
MNVGREAGSGGWRRAFYLDCGGVLAIVCAVILVICSFMIKRCLQALVQANPHLQDSTFEAVVFTSFLVTVTDVAILTTYLVLRQPSQLAQVRRLWTRMFMVGAASLTTSLTSYWAFSLTLVAYAAAVGQIESVLSVLLGLMIWCEDEVWRQIPGMALLIGGMILVLLA